MSRKDQEMGFVLNTPAISNQLLNFACAMIRCRRMDGRDDSVPAGWAVRQLLLNGRIGYLHSPTDAEGFYNIASQGQVDRYGIPTSVTARTQATGAHGFSVPVSKHDRELNGTLSVIRANASGTPPFTSMTRYAQMIARAELHINTNLLASMRSQVINAPDSQKAAIDIMLERAAQGLPSVIGTNLMEQLSVFDISVPLDAPEVHALYMQMWAEALKQFGGITPAAYKAERTQSAEVNATVAQSIDNVYILLDQANDDCKTWGVPYVFEYAGVGAMYDEQIDADTPKTQQDGQEEEEA